MEVFITHRMANPFLSDIQALAFYHLTQREINNVRITIEESCLSYYSSIKILSFSQGHQENWELSNKFKEMQRVIYFLFIYYLFLIKYFYFLLRLERWPWFKNCPILLKTGVSNTVLADASLSKRCESALLHKCLCWLVLTTLQPVLEPGFRSAVV